MGHLNRKYVSALKTLSDGVDFGPSRKYTFEGKWNDEGMHLASYHLDPIS